MRRRCGLAERVVGRMMKHDAVVAGDNLRVSHCRKISWLYVASLGIIKPSCRRRFLCSFFSLDALVSLCAC